MTIPVLLRGILLVVAGAALVPFRPSGAVLAQAALQRAPGARVVTVSQPPGGGEPSIAVNPGNPGQVVAVYQYPARAAYSTDSARTFAAGTMAAAPDWRGRGGDVTTTFDLHGHVWLSYIAGDTLGPARKPYYWGNGGRANGVFLRRSSDGGRTWDEPLTVWSHAPQPNVPFSDMPRLFADNHPHSPHAGNMYEGWIQWQVDSSIMVFARSIDDGRTWSPPIRVSTHAGLPRDANGDVVGFFGTTGPDGTIYAVWDRGPSIDFTSSHDGGRSFAPSRPIVPIGPYYMGTLVDFSSPYGALGCPQIAVDSRGVLYVTWSDFRNGDVDVFIARSADRGRTWSPARRVNSNPVHDGTDQFFQAMTVDPVTGALYVQFYDRRGDSANKQTSITLARSTDGGRSFVNYMWSDAPFVLHAIHVGDYMWLAAYDNRVYGVWTEPYAVPDSNAATAGAKAPTVVYRGLVRVGSADFTPTQ